MSLVPLSHALSLLSSGREANRKYAVGRGRNCERKREKKKKKKKVWLQVRELGG
jgi:hypothetical protein